MGINAEYISILLKAQKEIGSCLYDKKQRRAVILVNGRIAEKGAVMKYQSKKTSLKK